jgi:hypothetical protein
VPRASTGRVLASTLTSSNATPPQQIQLAFIADVRRDPTVCFPAVLRMDGPTRHLFDLRLLPSTVTHPVLPPVHGEMVTEMFAPLLGG